MSTNIHTGVKFKTGSIFEIKEKLKQFKDDYLVPEIEKDVFKLLVYQIVDAMDREKMGESGIILDRGDSLSSQFVLDFTHRQAEIRRTKMRDPEVDFSFEVAILPHLESGELLGIVYSEKSKFFDKFLELDFVEPFPYWNSTDRPDELTDEEWEKRGEIWDEACPTAPIECGFSTNLISLERFTYGLGFSELKAEDYKEYYPPKNIRVKKLAKDGMYKIFGESMEEEEIEALLEKGPGTYHSKFLRWYESEEAKEKEKELENEAYKTISDYYTQEEMDNYTPAKKDEEIN